MVLDKRWAAPNDIAASVLKTPQCFVPCATSGTLESFWLEEALKITESNRYPTPALPPVPENLISVCPTPPGMVTPALPWAACSNAPQPFGEEIVPQIQPQPPLAQLEAVSSCPGACSWGAEPDPPWLQAPFRQFRDQKVSPQLLFSRLNPPAPSAAPITPVLQPLPQLRSLLSTRSSTSRAFLA